MAGAFNLLLWGRCLDGCLFLLMLHLKTTKSRAQRCATNHNLGNKSRARKKKKCAWAEKNRAHGPVKARAQEIKNRAHGKQKKCALPVKSARMAQQKRAPHHKKVRARRPKSHAHAGKIARTSADGERRGFRFRGRTDWAFQKSPGPAMTRRGIGPKMTHKTTGPAARVKPTQGKRPQRSKAIGHFVLYYLEPFSGILRHVC